MLVAAGNDVSAAEDFYKGKTVKIIAGAAAGGGYDSHARLVAKTPPAVLERYKKLVGDGSGG